MKIMFRCDASLDIGSGHVMRCLTLADTLKSIGHDCTFQTSLETLDTIPLLSHSAHRIIQLDDVPPEDLDVLIVDHYGLDETYEQAMRAYTKRIIVIDDLANRTHDCDVLIDQTYLRSSSDYKELVTTHCIILTGTDYALLRPEYAELRDAAIKRRTEQAGKIERILIFYGSTNVHNITGKTLDAFKRYTTAAFEIDIVLGSKAAHLDDVTRAVLELNNDTAHTAHLHIDTKEMAQLMLHSDLSFGAGGTTSWERCCLGLPAIMVELADNQADIIQRLCENGIAVSLGHHSTFNSDSCIEALNTLHTENDTVNKMTSACFECIDGIGTKRLLPHILPAEQTKKGRRLTLREFRLADARIIFDWQNQPETRRYARTTHPPTWEEHQEWLARHINHPSKLGYIIMTDGTPCGCLRLDPYKPDNHTQGYEVSIFLERQFYNQGIAASALNMARTLMPAAHLYAEIHPENKASLKLFLARGYKALYDDWYINKQEQ